MNMNITAIGGTSNPVRTVTIDGEPWFIAADVAALLGFSTTAGAGWYARHLDDGERNTITLTTGGRGNPTKTVISESGLYKLIMRSDKAAAKPFQDWVCKVVLPAIRKDGMYIRGEEMFAPGKLDEQALFDKAVALLKQKAERLSPSRKQAVGALIEQI